MPWGGEYELFATVVILCSPLSSLNQITVIPTGILTSAGSNGDLPRELNGIVIVYDGILFNWYNIGGGKAIPESVGRSDV
jgi:hypothetical protein